MKWSLRLGSVAGIGIFVHWTFLILIAWIVYAYKAQGSDWLAAIQGVVFVLAVFGCIVLHELGHALTARRFGIRTRDITLLPIGGVARLERMPEDPSQELLVALAGPAVNIVIAAVLAGPVFMLQERISAADMDLVGGRFLTQLMLVNILLVVFNMIPAFPMDGGRVLRALLATKLGYGRATEIAATIGQGVAIVFGIVGLFGGHLMLLFIAMFVFLGAQQEAYSVQVKTMLRGVPTRDAMVTRFRSLHPDDEIKEVVGALISGEQQDFPVVADGSLVGVLARSDLVKHLAEGQPGVRVSAVMRTDCGTVDDAEMLEDSFQRMREAGYGMVPVVRDGQLVGLLTLENVGEWMMIQSALKKSTSREQVTDVFRQQ